MTRRRGLIAAAALLLAACCCGGPVTALLAWSTSSPPAAASGCGTGTGVDQTTATVAHLSAAQTRNAAAIITAGQQLSVPPRGWVIALATAQQESGLRVLANPAIPASMSLPHQGVGYDHDSVGLFQQRPSWGTTSQLMDPAASATKFYRKMLTVAGWQTQPLTEVAQAVQGSAYPDAYAKWEPSATQIVNALTHGGAAAAADTNPAAMTCAGGSHLSAAGWVAPVHGPISSPFGARGGSVHYGVDLAPPRGTTIVAASAGLVITATCDRSTGNCNTDGSITTPGCGWYVEIKHAGGIDTRYCHMQSRPLVHPGQSVRAGQPLGTVGMSGNADGPHLHLEVHLHNDLSSAGAVDPVPFMKAHGASVGKAS